MFDMFWIHLCDIVYSYLFSFNSYNITVKSEAVARSCFVKKVFLKIFKNLYKGLFFNTVAGLSLQLY